MRTTLDEQRRDCKPKQCGSLGLAEDGRMLTQPHELARACLIGGLNEYDTHGVNTERGLVLLLPLDEMVIGAKFLQHVMKRHTATITFISEMSWLCSI